MSKENHIDDDTVVQALDFGEHHIGEFDFEYNYNFYSIIKRRTFLCINGLYDKYCFSQTSCRRKLSTVHDKIPLKVVSDCF